MTPSPLRSSRCAVLVLCLAAAGAARGEHRVVELTPEEQAVRTLAGKIDLYVGGAWAASGTRPAPVADDAEFLRRVYLDLTGRIPPVSEARAFLADPAPDKRRRLVERLLDSPGYVLHFTNVYRALLIPEAGTNIQLRVALPSFEAWLRERVADNVGYDDLVRGILTVGLGRDMMRSPDLYEQGEASPLAFYAAKEAKPEGLAAATSRLFLGLRLECAQCHDHPFASWKREQFWNLAAFFAGLQPRGDNVFAPVREITGNREIMIPGKEQMVPAVFLDGTEPKFEYKVSTRITLADWITSPENPYFARTAANRIWALLFGIGIVDPPDDFGDEHPPSHPRLLDELARSFAAQRFDVKFLIRAITSSRAYQLSSVRTHPSQDDPRQFARMAVKNLTPEQLFDSVAQATGYREPETTPRSPGELMTQSGPRAEFLNRFAGQESRTEASTTILQALFLMNGHFVADVTSLERSQTLAAAVQAPFLDPAQQIETLFLATLSRPPRPAEAARLLDYVHRGGARGNPREALADVFWALLNSAEFAHNH